MAMMKYGRFTKMTSPPDKIKKNKDGTTTTTSGNISVTLSDWIQPDKTPTPKNKISEEEYNASEAKRQEVIAKNKALWQPYNDAVAAYQKEQEDYKAGLESYNRQMDFYNKGPEPEKEDPQGVKLTKGGKNNKGQDVTFQQGERYSAAKSNEDLKKELKDNKNIVDIYDKSINKSSRDIYLAQVGKGTGSDLYGKTTGKIYVDRDQINKIKSNRDVWNEDYDSVEANKASRSGKLDKWLASKGFGNRTFTSQIGSYSEYVTPTAPKKPTSQMPVKPVIEEEKVPEKIKASDVAVSKMPTRKVLSINMKTKAPYRKLDEVEEGSWTPPVRSKLNVSVDKSREGGQGGKWGLRNKIVGSGGNSKFKPSLRMSVTGGGGRREERMAKAFYSPYSDLGHAGYYSSMEGTEGDISKAIRSDIKDIRQEKREWKSQTDLKGADKRAGAKEFRKDIQTGRLSARYAKRGDLSSLGGEQWGEGKNSKLKTWTADVNKKGDTGAMSGYVSSAEKNIEAAGLYRQNELRSKSNEIAAVLNKQYDKVEGYVQDATDNATNRNTVIAQMAQYKGWGSKIK
jgi:hypothetical protein